LSACFSIKVWEYFNQGKPNKNVGFIKVWEQSQSLHIEFKSKQACPKWSDVITKGNIGSMSLLQLLDLT
jgi:hypothetical protein